MVAGTFSMPGNHATDFVVYISPYLQKEVSAAVSSHSDSALYVPTRFIPFVFSMMMNTPMSLSKEGEEPCKLHSVVLWF